MTYNVGNPGPWLGQVHNVAGLSLLMDPHPPLLNTGNICTLGKDLGANQFY
jgi:hypothetical protein